MDAPQRPTRNPFKLFQRGFERRFEAARAFYRRLLLTALGATQTVHPRLHARRLRSFALVPFPRAEFLSPDRESADGAACPRPDRNAIEETALEMRPDRAGDPVDFPPHALKTIVDNIGLPISGINMAYSNTGTIGASDADILITSGGWPRSRRARLREGDAAKACRADFPARTSRSSPPTSSRRS